AGDDDVLFDVALQPDGSIVAAGYRQSMGVNDAVAVRLTANGIPDASFGGTGIVVLSMGLNSDIATDVAIQADGKILVAGVATVFGNSDVALARLTGSGQADTSFGAAGRVQVNFGTPVD